MSFIVYGVNGERDYYDKAPDATKWAKVLASVWGIPISIMKNSPREFGKEGGNQIERFLLIMPPRKLEPKQFAKANQRMKIFHDRILNRK